MLSAVVSGHSLRLMRAGKYGSPTNAADVEVVWPVRVTSRIAFVSACRIDRFMRLSGRNPAAGHCLICSYPSFRNGNIARRS